MHYLHYRDTSIEVSRIDELIPFFKLQAAQLAMEIGDKETAKKQVGELRKLAWSPVYYPEMPGYLEGFLTELEK